MSIWRRLFPKLQCPTCGGKVERVLPDVTVGYIAAVLGGQLLLELLWAILAAIIAAVTFHLFGQIAGFAVLMVFLIYFDRRIARYKCISCSAEFRRDELLPQDAKVSGRGDS